MEKYTQEQIREQYPYLYEAHLHTKQAITAGSDIHQVNLYGGETAFRRWLKDGADYVKAVSGGEDYALTDGVRWFSRNGQELIYECSVVHRGRDSE